MPFRFGGTTWFLIVLFLIAFTRNVLGRCSSVLNVTNDGPAILDVPVTVTAHLDCPNLATELVYLFEDDLLHTIEAHGHQVASAEFIFSDRVGTRTVRVTALLRDQFEVAFGKTTFQVQEYLPGSLNFTGVIRDRNGRKYVGTGWKTNISALLQVSPRLMKESEFAYSWTIGEEHFTTQQPFITHRFSEPGQQWVRMSVVGRIPTYDGTQSFQYKWAYFDEDVLVKDPFSSINISGNTYLEHGQLLDLNIYCNGSGPVHYCWKVLPQTENQTNLSCTDPVISTECSFPILYYFRDSGDYRLAIYVNNTITSMQRNIEVHIYDVSLRPQLSTIIIPMICTILVVLIIASALVIHMRRHTHYDIETADFDFMRHESSKMAVETSWEVMRRSLLHLLQIHCLCTAAEVSATPAASYGTIHTSSTGATCYFDQEAFGPLLVYSIGLKRNHEVKRLRDVTQINSSISYTFSRRLF